MGHCITQNRLCLVDVIGDAGANAVADEEIRVAALRRGQNGPSGTEAVYKIYAESFKDEQHLQAINAQQMVSDA